MNHVIALIFLSAAILISPAQAEPKATKPRPIKQPAAVTPSTPRLHEFQGEEIIPVLQALARGAGVTIIISEPLAGTVTAKIENKTPIQALRIIADAKELIVEEKEGVLYIRSQNPLPPPAESKKSEDPDQFEDTLRQYITAISRQVQVAARDPSITDAFAEYYWNLFSALRKKGFTEQQAILIMSQATVPIDLPDK